ncbi:MAG TPA: 30S ribosome-binding factor RbfA [Candidatus Hydrogenedentes bacterium]|nr:30S ribosome-binding factor RbfA [Candidatus Hydrogenedentota bacterium]HIJ74011.1 30S ribosome-binding factor RbfA [Candidatus Hydrogenedentota bacterium]
MTRQRGERVAELIREEIAGLVTKGLKDPRIGFVSVMAVKMSPDLRHANVYVSLYGTDKERNGSLIGLRNSAGWIRKQIGKRIRLHWTPEIRFFEDGSLDRVFRLEEIFREMHAEEKEDEHGPG